MSKKNDNQNRQPGTTRSGGTQNYWRLKDDELMRQGHAVKQIIRTIKTARKDEQFL